MDMLKKLPREVQVVLGGSLLYLIFSFLDWQQVSFLGAHAGISEWHGVGVIAGLLALALLLWEGTRLFGARLDRARASPASLHGDHVSYAQRGQALACLSRTAPLDRDYGCRLPPRA